MKQFILAAISLLLLSSVANAQWPGRDRDRRDRDDRGRGRDRVVCAVTAWDETLPAAEGRDCRQAARQAIQNCKRYAGPAKYQRCEDAGRYGGPIKGRQYGLECWSGRRPIRCR